jgi:uncharacterized protein YllA (UPF0747 family)
MPVVYPRARCILTSRKLKQLMQAFQFSLSDLAGSPEELMERALNHVVRIAAQEVVQRRRRPIEEVLRPLAEELEPVNKSAAAMARKLLERVQADLDRIERTIMKGDEERIEATRKQVGRLCTSVFPFRKPQERALSIFSFLFEHGWGLIPRLIKELDIESFAVKEVEL